MSSLSRSRRSCIYALSTHHLVSLFLLFSRVLDRLKSSVLHLATVNVLIYTYAFCKLEMSEAERKTFHFFSFYITLSLTFNLQKSTSDLLHFDSEIQNFFKPRGVQPPGPPRRVNHGETAGEKSLKGVATKLLCF